MTDHLTFADGAYNRHSERRVDDAFMDALWSDPKTKVLLVGGEHVSADDHALVWRSADDVPDGDRLYLGTVDGTEHAAVMLERVPPPARALRSLATELGTAQAVGADASRDPFGASVALWWTAENFMDMAPYINDARALELILLGGVTGQETDGHDWENILSTLGWLRYDHRLAHLSYNVGIALMLAGCAGTAPTLGSSMLKPG